MTRQRTQLAASHNDNERHEQPSKRQSSLHLASIAESPMRLGYPNVAANLAAVADGTAIAVHNCKLRSTVRQRRASGLPQSWRSKWLGEGMLLCPHALIKDCR